MPRRGQEQLRILTCLPICAATKRTARRQVGTAGRNIALPCGAPRIWKVQCGSASALRPCFCRKDGSFHFDVPICVSDQFYGWSAALAADSGRPPEVRQGMRKVAAPGWQNSINNRKQRGSSSPFLYVYGFSSRSLGRRRSSSAAGSATRRQLWWKMALSGCRAGRRPLPAVRASGLPAGIIAQQGSCSFRPDGTPVLCLNGDRSSLLGGVVRELDLVGKR